MSRQIACRPLRLLFAGLLLVTAGCAAEPTPYVERPVEEIYNGAMDRLAAGDYEAAAKEFDEVERQHPYSVWATKAQLMAAYALYEAEKFDDAVIAIDRFIQLHPTNQDAAYAFYLKSLSYYAQISDVGRDQKITGLALAALEELVRRYPTSEYARDARLKIDLTRDHLAGKEMEIGRFYLRRDYLLAAINRFRVVVQDYQTTSHVPEALHRLVEAYEALGMSDQAARVAAVLGHNYPGSDWYVDTYELVEGPAAAPDDSGFFARTWEEAFSGTKKVGISPDEAERLAAQKVDPEPIAPTDGEGAESRTVLRAPQGTTGGSGGGGDGWLSRQWGSVFGSDETATASATTSTTTTAAVAGTAAAVGAGTASGGSEAATATGEARSESEERPGWFSRQMAAVFGDGADEGAETPPAEPSAEAEMLESAKADSRRAAEEAQRQAAAAAEVAAAAERRAARAATTARETEENQTQRAREAARRFETLTTEATRAAEERAKAQKAADYWSEQASSVTDPAAVAEARANADAAGKAVIYWREAERYARHAAETERKRAGTLVAAAPDPTREPTSEPTSGRRAATEVVVAGRTPSEPAVTAAPLASDSGSGTAAAPPGSSIEAWMRDREAALDRAAARTGGPIGEAAASRQASARMSDAYTTALAQAREEQTQARAAMEYWAAAATSGGTVPPQQAEENRRAAERALVYWQERERVLQEWHQGRGAGVRSAETAPSDGPGMFERVWRSVF